VLERLTAESFAQVVGETFALDAGDAGRLELELLESRLHDPDAPAADASGKRAPFSVLFRGPVEPVLPQRIYHLEHSSVGAIEIFIVPVARDVSGTTYEAVFG
jgi:hypothetical protein